MRIDVLVDDLWCIAKGRPIHRPIADVCAEAVMLLSAVEVDGKKLFEFYAEDLVACGLRKEDE